MTVAGHRPRVLVVTPWFPSEREPGAGSFILRDVQELAKACDVTVIHLGAPQFFGVDTNTENQYDTFRVLREPFAVTNYVMWVRAARLISRELRRTDLLHTMAYPCLAPFTLTRVRVPWVHTEHFSGLLSEPKGNLRSRALQRQLRGLLRRPDRMIAVSRFLADGIARYRPGAIKIVGNAVPTETGQRSTQPWDFSSLRMLGVGRISEAKGAHDAVGALITLRSRGVDASLTWVGAGPEEARLRALGAASGVQDHLRFTGQVDMHRVREELEHANVFVLPTRSETFGVAIAEAFASGLPIVTGNRGGFTDVLAPEASRMIDIANLSADTVAEAVEELTASPDLPSRSEIAGLARNTFDEYARVKAILDVYAELGVETCLPPQQSEPRQLEQNQIQYTDVQVHQALAGKRIAFLLRGRIANDARVQRAAEAAHRMGAETVLFYRANISGPLGEVPDELGTSVVDMRTWKIPFTLLDAKTSRYRLWVASGHPVMRALIRVPRLGIPLVNAIVNYRLSRRLAHELRRLNVDLVHAHDANTLTLARVASRGIAPYVYDAHEMWRGNYQRPPSWLLKAFMRRVERLGMRHAAGFITVSPSIMRWYRSEYDFRGPTALVRNIPEPSSFSGEPRSVKAELGMTTKDPLMLYGGAVMPHRGIEESIKALTFMPENSHLVVVGYGEERYFDELVSLAKDSGVAERVHFLGAVAHKELLSVVAQADVSLVCIQPISPSYRFSLPNKLFEAVQAGVPVVATKLPDIHEFVERHGIGLCIDDWTPASLAAALNHVLDNGETYCNALRQATEQVSWSREVRELARLYTDVLKSGAAP